MLIARRIPWLVVSLLLPAAMLPAQAGSPGEATISVDVNLVVLHATVRDRQGGFRAGLQKDDFQVFENGHPEAIRLFQHEDTPVSVGLVVDNSSSMHTKRKDVTAAALVFAHASNPRDQMFVVNFNGKVTLGLPAQQLFSSNPVELETALNGVPARGRTALYDAVEAGLAHLKKASLDKKVLILITDGGDNASRCTRGQVLKDAAASNAIIYTIGLLDEYEAEQNPGFLRRIARVTGGAAFFPEATSEVAEICRRIAEDIRQQYTIGYVSSDQKLDNTYRRIRVTAHDPKNERLLVRTRAGYLALPHAKTP